MMNYICKTNRTSKLNEKSVYQKLNLKIQILC